MHTQSVSCPADTLPLSRVFCMVKAPRFLFIYWRRRSISQTASIQPNTHTHTCDQPKSQHHKSTINTTILVFFFSSFYNLPVLSLHFFIVGHLVPSPPSVDNGAAERDTPPVAKSAPPPPPLLLSPYFLYAIYQTLLIY